jgi:hypothetical protein
MRGFSIEKPETDQDLAIKPRHNLQKEQFLSRFYASRKSSIEVVLLP